ncbi:hypothetical protein P7K49_004431 [Saguinus oedipus]|uniref:Uncharacterized protein n=1 Tax=Saguinus oedipus TaxID=9490 RepID=A0ABQ9W7E7_SAGOE|nr:hypothetical protein P7K49_004431 [Saguinus oedipus]
MASQQGESPGDVKAAATGSQVHESSGLQNDHGQPSNDLQRLTAPTWVSVTKSNASLLKRKSRGWKTRSNPAESQVQNYQRRSERLTELYQTTSISVGFPTKLVSQM